MRPNARLTAEHQVNWSPHRDDDGVEFWHFPFEITFPGRTRSSPEITATAATASIWRVRLLGNFELSYELDNISYDLGLIGRAITDSRRMRTRGISGGQNVDIVIAGDVVVDPFWRGGQLGPAVVALAAELLAADGVFLMPVALPTEIGDDGRCHSDYGGRRPGPEAQAKVEAAWRRGGYRNVRDGVVWSSLETKDGKRARATLERAELMADSPAARSWARRRARRAARSGGERG